MRFRDQANNVGQIHPHGLSVLRAHDRGHHHVLPVLRVRGRGHHHGLRVLRAQCVVVMSSSNAPPLRTVS